MPDGAPTPVGRVFLVGTGPGDPGLITVRGRQVLETADVVVYDGAVPPGLLQLAAGARRVRARGGGEEVELLLQHAREGCRVVRLTPGDPSSAGAGHKEAETVATAGIPVELVPGLPAAAAAPRLAWLQRLPLGGRTVLVTRSRAQADALSRLIAEYGGQPEEFATIRIVPPADYGPLDRALADVAGYDWLVFTSVNGVHAVLDRLSTLGLDVRAWQGVRLAAIGASTAGVLRERGLVPALVPDEFRAEALVEAFAGRKAEVAGRRVLLARAQEARRVLPDGLAALGARVDEVAAYRTVAAHADGEALRERLAAGAIDVVTLTSSSTVRNFCALLGPQAAALSRRAAVACIGPITARTAEECGLQVSVVAAEYTLRGLVEAIVRWCRAAEQR